MTPLNAILNVTDILQTMLHDDVVGDTVQDLQKIPASRASSQPAPANLVAIVSQVHEDKKKFYDFSRVIWSSA